MNDSTVFSYKNTIKSKNKLKHRNQIKCLMLNQCCNAYMNLGISMLLHLNIFTFAKNKIIIGLSVTKNTWFATSKFQA